MLLTALLTLLALAPAQSVAPDTSRILFIGNSFTYANDLPAMVEAVAVQAGRPRPETAMVAFPNAALEDHWQEGTARRRLAESRWDFVVLQQGPSTLPESRAQLVEWTARFAPLIRAAGAEPVLYMVWPGLERLAYTGDGLASYRAAAREVGGRLAPAGEAWRRALAAVPQFTVAAVDGFHPSVAGTYLAAVVILATIGGPDPPLLPDRIPGHPEVPAAAVADLQRVARESLGQ